MEDGGTSGAQSLSRVAKIFCILWQREVNANSSCNTKRKTKGELWMLVKNNVSLSAHRLTSVRCVWEMILVDDCMYTQGVTWKSCVLSTQFGYEPTHA